MKLSMDKIGDDSFPHSLLSMGQPVKGKPPCGSQEWIVRGLTRRGFLIYLTGFTWVVSMWILRFQWHHIFFTRGYGCGRNPPNQLRLVVYEPIYLQGLGYIPGGAVIFLPSTVWSKVGQPETLFGNYDHQTDLNEKSSRFTMVGENSELPLMLTVHQPFFLAKKHNWEMIIYTVYIFLFIYIYIFFYLDIYIYTYFY